jgi:hypothetical protein
VQAKKFHCPIEGKPMKTEENPLFAGKLYFAFWLFAIQAFEV